MPANSRPPQKGDHVFLVDGSAYIYRAFHALPPLTRKSDGLQLGAVFGFCGMLLKLFRYITAEVMPTDKVIEVQALIGDSTDNVPGVPGIGVKTAAQLIGEYGDLETLLGRASEIKQQKRRETLIENAEQARLSKTLVTLDAHVPVEVPLADIAVHDPDARRLIAFLKAMEFNTLTRRVAEFSGADPAGIEPDETLKANGAGPAPQPAAASAPARGQGELFAPPAPPPGRAAGAA